MNLKRILLEMDKISLEVTGGSGFDLSYNNIKETVISFEGKGIEQLENYFNNLLNFLDENDKENLKDIINKFNVKFPNYKITL